MLVSVRVAEKNLNGCHWGKESLHWSWHVPQTSTWKKFSDLCMSTSILTRVLSSLVAGLSLMTILVVEIGQEACSKICYKGHDLVHGNVFEWKKNCMHRNKIVHSTWTNCRHTRALKYKIEFLYARSCWVYLNDKF